MTTFSANQLYIVVTYIRYSGISGDLDNLYDDKEEAQRMADKMSRPDRNLPNLGSLKYSVMTLDDYIDEVKSEARSDGRQDERDSQSGNW
jgi:hypothetical protein